MLTTIRKKNGIIGRAKFEPSDRNTAIITELASPLLSEPFMGAKEQMINNSSFNQPCGVFSIKLNLEMVFCQN